MSFIAVEYEHVARFVALHDGMSLRSMEHASDHIFRRFMLKHSALHQASTKRCDIHDITIIDQPVWNPGVTIIERIFLRVGVNGTSIPCVWVSNLVGYAKRPRRESITVLLRYLIG